MYLDCPVCGWESPCFVMFRNARQVARTASGSWESLPHGKTIYKCPNGHVANLAPSTLKIYKRQANKVIDELTPEEWFESKLESSDGPPRSARKKYETSD